MKKLISAIAFVIIGSHAFCQYDYFQWPKTLNLSIGSTIQVKSGLAVDEFNIPIYISSISTVSWQWGTILSSAPLARSNSNIGFANYTTGDFYFYIRSDNKMGCIHYLNTTGYAVVNQYAVDNIANGSSIAISDTNEVFYIRSSDNKVCDFYKNSGGSGYGPLNSSAITAEPWSNIIYNSTSNSIFYIGSNQKIAGLHWNGTTWVTITLSSDIVTTNSKIQESGSTTSFNVYYVRSSDNRICNYYYNPSSSGYAVLSSTATPAMTGTNIISYGNGQVDYIGNDGNVHCLYWDGCGYFWDKLLNNTCSINSNYPALAEGPNTALFFYSSNDIYTIAPQTNTGFVYKQGDRLMLNGVLYNPIAVDYLMEIHSNDSGTTLYPSPTDHYSDDWKVAHWPTPSTSSAAIDSQFADIASLGFTAIRCNGLGVLSNPTDSVDPKLYITSFQASQTEILMDTGKLFKVYDTVLYYAGKHNLKVNAYIGFDYGAGDSASYSNYTTFLTQFAHRYRNDKRIWCYSLILEPSDVAASRRITNKSFICATTNTWNNAVKSVDQNHLTTIGLTGGMFTLQDWDPAIENVDFLTFHVYPDANNIHDATYEVVRQNLKWTSDIMAGIGKPWIIGETGYPGASETNLSQAGSWQEQLAYGLFIESEAFSAGASALTWWNYRDYYFTGPDADPVLNAEYSINKWDDFGNYTGVESSHFQPDTLKKIVAFGTNIFRGYMAYTGCSCSYTPTNYYDTIHTLGYTITGTVRDSTNHLPLKDAIVIGWTSGFTNPVFTLTQANGTYKLMSSSSIDIVQVAALDEVTSSSPTALSTLTIWSPSSPLKVGMYPATCSRHLNPIKPNSIPLLADESDYRIYPNPAKDNVTVEGDNIMNVEVYSIVGQKITEVDNKDNNNQVVISLTNQTTGVFILKITTRENTVITKKVVKL